MDMLDFLTTYFTIDPNSLPLMLLILVLAFYRNRQLWKLANFDGKTHAYVIRCLMTESVQLMQSGKTFGLIFIDLDNFKQINDTQGHSHGDFILKTTVRLIVNEIRSRVTPKRFFKKDRVFRYGGDEFCILVRVETKSQLCTIAKRISEVLQNAEIAASIGCALHTKGSPISYEDLINKVDKAVYKSKECGKNCITTYQCLKTDLGYSCDKCPIKNF